MKKAKFTVSIEAPKEKVWQILWNDDSYPKWTAVFSEGSKAVSDWNEGSKILFVNENNDGMHSIIVKKIDNEIMHFKHLGMVKNGIELPQDEISKSWSGATENYHLSEANGTTILTVEMDIVEEYSDYFNEKFPLALKIVKELTEI
ncbi:Activator of Hsp90 ATPase-like protein [Flavobacterium cauense R2A-7]|uniref:Activator of Hsp90 ATPase-like protein n=1 Tax=Flavobacterium cauense R2A-7 TaxID=1341154 RepID=V6S356_9FLAO|nr:actin of Hsp90 ATPase-like protein [Flavobacterium cauense]ESU20667.1 Activator of Hsp90 ATPase-like protein [Flavobacterium cauense R2A-7]KGO82956.1 ATPase [Flavobacterium cauense R2A-7]TWI10764.1 hypothetical protein IP98_02113 [Flavobacterium cauense R2A-7]